VYSIGRSDRNNAGPAKVAYGDPKAGRLHYQKIGWGRLIKHRQIKPPSHALKKFTFGHPNHLSGGLNKMPPIGRRVQDLLNLTFVHDRT
jgi:hypothetical protein